MIKKKPKEIVPGDVLILAHTQGRARRGNQDQLALVLSNEYPAGSYPKPGAYRYCEPLVVYLAHQRDDRWLETHRTTYMLLDINKQVEIDTSLRIQYPPRFGSFLDHEQLVEHLSDHKRVEEPDATSADRST